MGSLLFCPLFYLDICVAFPLAVNAAAVLLTVEVKRFGKVTAVRISFTEVRIEEFNTFCLRNAGPDFAYQVVLLVGADEQRGSKSAEVPFTSTISGSGEAHLKAVAAAFAFMSDHLAEVIDDFVPLTDNQGNL